MTENANYATKEELAALEKKIFGGIITDLMSGVPIFKPAKTLAWVSGAVISLSGVVLQYNTEGTYSGTIAWVAI